MGIAVSTPNYIPREDQLAFPPEILEKIAKFLTAQDICVARKVCQGWMTIIAECGMLERSMGIRVEKSEYILQELSKSPLPLTFTAFFLRNLELTRRTLTFWKLYSDMITYLEFTDCAILPRNPTGLKSDHEFALGCPNLKFLGLKSMDKYFMMGGQFLQLHEILCLDNLESLDLSNNKYLSDQIIFDILMKTRYLKSLNLSCCPVLFVRAVHNRFYPKNCKRPPYSDNILSFETLVDDFFMGANGCHIRELKLQSTTVNSYALKLISDPTVFHWESIDLSDCREVKAQDYFDFISNQSCHLKKLILSTSSSKLSDRPFLQNELADLEHLEVKGCREIKNLEFLRNLPKLKFLNIDSCEVNCSTEDFLHATKFQCLIMNSLVLRSDMVLTEVCTHFRNVTELSLAECGTWITDAFIQSVIKNLTKLKLLNVRKTLLTDRGIAGTELDDFEESRYPTKIIEAKRAAVIERLQNIPDGQSLSDLNDLQVLNLSHCLNLGEATWKLALKFPSLANLDLSGCSQLTPKGLHAIVKNCPSLECINLIHCGNITSQPELISSIQKSLYRLRRLII